MRGKFARRLVLDTLLLCQLSVCLARETTDANDSSKYLYAVRELADNVLKYRRDTYGPKHTPLFVDGLNIHTHKPVKWIDPGGKTIHLIFLGRDRFNVRKADLTISGN